MYEDPHKDIVAMYAEQDRLHAESLAKPFMEWFEPIVVTKREMITIGFGCRIDSFVKLEGGRGLRLDRFIHVASFAHLNIGGGSLIVGEGAAFASGAKVITGGNQLAGESMSAVAPMERQALAWSEVTIGENAALLANAVLIGGSLGKGAVLAAGAVAVYAHIPPGEVWGGVPARRLRARWAVTA